MVKEDAISTLLEIQRSKDLLAVLNTKTVATKQEIEARDHDLKK